MNYMTKIADYEAAVERRLEKSCEWNGWIASAHASLDADYVDCQLEKFGREEVWDEADALNSLEAFLSHEFGFRLADKPTALRRDSEKIPNTIAPYHLVLNAAVPVEAYDEQDGVTVASKHDMTPPEWRPYPDRVRSTHWFELPWQVLPFGTLDDARKGLTWKGLFKDVDNTVNFYSSRDEVVANGNDDVDELLSREFAWYNQEQAKGFLLVSLSPQAGWKFGDHYMVRIDTGNWENGAPVYDYRRYTPQETLTIADTNLMVRPFFRDFRDKEIYGEGGGDFVQTNAFIRWYALSHGIPAESFAVGANPVPKWEAAGNNIDMAVYCNPAEKSNKPVKWVHSYFIGNSLFDTRKLYEELVKQIGSTKTKEEQANE